MKWTRRTLMVALAMRDKGSSQQRWELYQRLCQNEWTEGKFTLEAIHQELSLEELEWLRNTDFTSLELQYRKENIHFFNVRRRTISTTFKRNLFTTSCVIL